MTNALCGDEMCPAVRDGLIVYRDDNHLTGRYAAKMASILEPYLLGASGPGPSPAGSASSAH